MDYDLKRNGSGYYDETAYKAFLGMAKSGDVWTTGDGREQVLILKNQGRFCNCLSLREQSDDKDCIEIVSAGTMYTNPAMVKYLFNTRLGTFVQRIPAIEFEKVVEAVEDALGIRREKKSNGKDCRKECHELLDKILEKAGVL